MQVEHYLGVACLSSIRVLLVWVKGVKLLFLLLVSEGLLGICFGSHHRISMHFYLFCIISERFNREVQVGFCLVVAANRFGGQASRVMVCGVVGGVQIRKMCENTKNDLEAVRTYVGCVLG